MDIEKLLKLSKQDPGASKRAVEGFKERLKQSDKKFSETKRSMEPGKDFYNRVYDV